MMLTFFGTCSTTVDSTVYIECKGKNINGKFNCKKIRVKKE